MIIFDNKIKAIVGKNFENDYDNQTFLRMLKNSSINGDCWICKLSKTKTGYAVVSYHGEHNYAHRISAYLFLGLDLNGNKQANHKPICVNKACWNPDHIYVGTQLDNMYDRRGRIYFQHCGHPRENNTYINKNGWRQCKICRAVHNRNR